MIQKIIACIDGSNYSLAVCDAAVVHVIDKNACALASSFRRAHGHHGFSLYGCVEPRGFLGRHAMGRVNLCRQNNNSTIKERKR